MTAGTWKYIENQIEVATRGSRMAMNTVVVDHAAKLTAASTAPGADPRLAALLAAFLPKKTAWSQAYAAWRNLKSGYGGGTQLFEGLLRELAVQPGPEQTSKIENWDARIRAAVPRGGAVYKTLLPEGREAFSSGHRDEIVTAVQNLGLRLAEQTTKPELVALGTEVTGFYEQLVAARDSQQGTEGSVVSSAAAIEAQRKSIATALYGNLGMLMNIFQETPATVAGFFDLATLRQSAANGGTPASPANPPAQP